MGCKPFEGWNVVLAFLLFYSIWGRFLLYLLIYSLFSLLLLKLFFFFFPSSISLTHHQNIPLLGLSSVSWVSTYYHLMPVALTLRGLYQVFVSACIHYCVVIIYHFTQNSYLLLSL